MSELDFPTDGHVWLAHARRGVEIEWLRSPDGLTIPLEEYDRAIDDRTAVVMVNRVLYRSSAVADAKEICRIARERGALSVPRRLPRDRHRAARPARPRLRRLRGRGAEMALRRSRPRFLYVRRDLIPTLEPMVTGWFGDGGSVLVRHAAPRVPPVGAQVRARHAAGPRLLPRPGRARHHQRGDARADPRAAGRAHRPRDRSRRRDGPRRCEPRATGPRAAASSTSASVPRPGRSATRFSSATCAPTTAATACGSARTSSTPRTRSTTASRSSARSSRSTAPSPADGRRPGFSEPDDATRRARRASGRRAPHLLERVAAERDQVGRAHRARAASPSSRSAPPRASSGRPRAAGAPRGRRCPAGSARSRGPFRRRPVAPAARNRTRLSHAVRSSGVTSPYDRMSSVETTRIVAGRRLDERVRTAARSTACARTRRSRRPPRAPPVPRPGRAPSPAALGSCAALARCAASSASDGVGPASAFSETLITPAPRLARLATAAAASSGPWSSSPVPGGRPALGSSGSRPAR